MAFSVISAPSVLPVTLAQIKQYLRIDYVTDDQLLDDLANAATVQVESQIGQFLIERTIRQYADAVPAERILCLETWPVQTITGITGFDAQGNPVLLDPAYYTLVPGSDPQSVRFETGYQSSAYPNGLEIDFVSGFGATGLDVPSNIVRAILVLCAHWYENRGANSSPGNSEIFPEGVERLLKPQRRVKL